MAKPTILAIFMIVLVLGLFYTSEFVILNIVLIGVLTSGKDLASVLMEPKSAAALSNMRLGDLGIYKLAGCGWHYIDPYTCIQEQGSSTEAHGASPLMAEAIAVQQSLNCIADALAKSALYGLNSSLPP
ncbi:hypothetical protein F2Q69_00049620, partial [Brassica cretica]